MLFNSYSFIFLFLPISTIGTFLIGRLSRRLAALWLAVASLLFYAVWNFNFLYLLISSIFLNYCAGVYIGRQRVLGTENRCKLATIFVIILDLSLLGYFKYVNFAIDTVNTSFFFHLSRLDVVLPLGISFFTFTQIAFLVDVYRGSAREYNFIHYLLFVTYFPHLIAGPVLHHKQMMPQFGHPETYLINWENIAVGFTVFVFGLAKKVLVADNCARYATPIFAAAGDGKVLMFFEAWIGALTYTFQLYFDFSGYSDMAVGLSLLFNVRLPQNFNSPYKATNIIDFWRRWHITLSVFMRDYLYIPLGGNKKGAFRRYLNLMITMLLGGLWHGAGWTFIVWGGLHGVYLMINHGWRALKARFDWEDGGRVAKVGSGALTFLVAVVAWVLFRANNFTTAYAMLAGMVGLNGVSLPVSMQSRLAPAIENLAQLVIVFRDLCPNTRIQNGTAIINIFVCSILIWGFPNVRQILHKFKPTLEDIGRTSVPSTNDIDRIASWMTWKFTTSRAVLIGLLFFICFMSLTKVSEFIYFQF